MYAGGKNYYRITPDRDEISLEAFKVDAADPTFSVNGVTVAFPGGKIIETGNVREVGTYGYWVETDPDVKPVITKCADYWKTYPAYKETYDGFEVGMEYNFKTALPIACWEAKKAGVGGGTIVADPADATNKMLALTGTYTLKNVNMPKNVTAGDTYAEHQAWEVMVSIPADMAADAEVILLNYVGDSNKKAQDGGVKIAGGKLYYDQKGEYVEMPEFTVEPNTKYTVVREMDLSDTTAYKSSYRVYDSVGKLLAKAENIPLAELIVPVMSISIGCVNVTGDPVLLDNYKLYQTQVGYDFELFDTTTGMQAKDITQARTADTTYRLSWLNATQSEKIYSVVAAYYNGETLVSEKVVKELKLAPNADGAEIGNVEKAEGQTMKIYLRDDTPTESAPPTEPAVDYTWVIIAAAAVVVIVAVIAVVIMKKKKSVTGGPQE